MRPRRPEGTRGPLLYAVARRLHLADMRDRIDRDLHYRDGEVALAATLASAVTPDELALCRRVATREEDPRVLGPAPSDEAVRLAVATLVETAGVRWGPEGWELVDDAN